MAKTIVRPNAEDLNVVTTVVYANTSNALFYDAEFKTAVPAADCLNLFLKGVVAVKSNVYYKAVSCTKAGVINFGFPS